LIYGPPKVGKSTWCSQIPGAIFLPTERGLDHIECYQVPDDRPCIATWAEFLEAAALLAKPGHPFKAVVVDTVDNAYRLCTDHVCAGLGISHPADLGYGKGFAMVNNEFIRVFNRLSALPYGLYLTSHAKTIEEETRTGKRMRTIPTLPGKAREYVLGLVDIVLFADVVDGKRQIHAAPSTRYEAGDRTGRLPASLPLDAKAFIKVFEDKKGKTS
jgi:hypothetical protein